VNPETQLKLLDYLEQARESKTAGIQLEFATPDDAKLFRTKLYAARRGIDDFEGMTFILRGSTLMIVKGQDEDE
jgi:hypothetical protein